MGILSKLEFYIFFSVFFILIFAHISHAEILINDQNVSKESYGLTFTVIDRSKCYNSTFYKDEDLLEPIYFNESTAKLFYDILDEGLTKEYGDKRKFYIKKYPIDRFYFYDSLSLEIVDEQNNVYIFQTDGYWWSLTLDKKGFNIFTSESYENIGNEYHKSMEIFQAIISRIELAFRTFLRDSEIAPYGFCEMNYYGEPQLFQLTDVYYSNTYFDKMGCSYAKGDIYADCSKSKIYNSIKPTHAFWRFKDSKSQITFKDGNNFVFLDKSNIEFVEGKKQTKRLGFQIVLSESRFFDGFGSGQVIFVDSYNGHYAYLRALDEVYLATQKTEKLNKVIEEKIDELNKKNTEVINIFRSADNLEDKRKRIEKITDFNASIEDYNERLVEFENFYERTITLKESVENIYFGIYYQDISNSYINDLKLEMDKLRSNLARLENRQDIFNNNLRDSLIDIQSQVDTKETQKISNVGLILTLVITILALFATLSMNSLQEIADKFSFRVMKEVRKYLILIFIFFIVTNIIVFYSVITGILDFSTFIYILSSELVISIIFAFMEITNFMSYNKALKIIKEGDLKIIKKFKDASKIQKNNLLQKLIPPEIYREFIFHKEVSERLHDMYALLEISDILNKAVENNNSSLTKLSLNTLFEITQFYTQQRKDLAQAEDKFLTEIFEELEYLSKISISKKNKRITNYIIKTVEKIGIETLEIKNISPIFVDNTTQSSIWYLALIGLACDEDLSDSTVESINSIAEIGKQAAIKTKKTTFSVSKILEILVKKQSWYVSHRGVAKILLVINEEVKNLVDKHSVSTDIEDLSKAVLISNRIVKNELLLNGAIFGLSLEYNSIYKIVRNLIVLKRANFPIAQTKHIEDYIKYILSEMIEFLKTLKQNYVKLNKERLILSINETCDEVIELLSQEKLKSHEDKDFSKEIKELEYIKRIK
ncbi:MAG: hypothetical protein HYW26_05620 [Candidatus Aenigmarchaeota archaeon]|nr:hypothetical protein [Candidatus Aenigmarchaeota archaeon]